MNSVPSVRFSNAEILGDCALFSLDHTGRVNSWNGAAKLIFGYTDQEIVGQSFALLFLPEDQARSAPARLLAEVESKGRVAQECRRVRKDGIYFWADFILQANGAGPHDTGGYIAMVRDNTERRRSLKYSTMMVELAMNAMIMVNAQGLLIAVNPQAEKMFGYSAHELIGEPVELLVPIRFRPEHPANRERFFAAPAVRTMGSGRDLFAQRKDGSEFPVEIGLNPVETDEGLVILGSIVDITERKNFESQARRLLLESAHAARLSTVGEMISGLAHEINQPLAAASNYLRGCIRLAQSGRQVTSAELIHWMDLAAAQTTRACEIVTRLGAFVKKGESQRSQVNLNQLIEQTLSLSITTLDSTKDATYDAVAVQHQLDSKLPLLKADRVQIQQVLSNLIRNAVEAMRETPTERRLLQIRSEQVGNYVKVSVTDSGSGVSPDHLQHLFEAFFTTKETGIGLGLSISRSIIEQHGGELTVRSIVGQGTTFSFTLPLTEVEAS